MAEALAHHHNLPMFSLAGVSDAKLVDQQAGIEAALTLMVEAVTGGHIVHDLGYLESGLSYSLAQLVICDEIVAWIKHFVQDVEVTDETLALDVIDQVGLGRSVPQVAAHPASLSRALVPPAVRAGQL